MVDIKNQYLHLKEEIDRSISGVIDSSIFINGPVVQEFGRSLASFLNSEYVIPCGNGTDALQIALMALDLQKGDEVIVPAFTYVATAEVISLLGLIPVMIDVDSKTFNCTDNVILNAITNKTKAIVPVHLFGQCCDIERTISVCKEEGISIIEDNAQSIGAEYTSSNGEIKMSGTLGEIGTTSFYPSKNLGAYGDGGAINTNNGSLATKIRMIANHGQRIKYVHDLIGCNSRLDAIQAAILKVKLKYLKKYIQKRQQAAAFYDEGLKSISEIDIPFRQGNSTHVFHQYTIKVKNGRRNDLKNYLSDHGIPSMIYYPIPLYKQKAFSRYYDGDLLPITERLCQEVLSLPIHTELEEDQQSYIIEKIIQFFKK